METVEPTVFELIKLECDGQQSCDLDFIAYVVSECEVDYYADYEQVFYDCLPFDMTEAIGFSVRLSLNIDLVQYEVIPFEDVISDFGGHYNMNTYAFTCPVHGVYMFSMSISQVDRSQIQGVLYHNNVPVSRKVADAEGFRDSASTTVVIECNTGDQVFVMVGQGGRFQGDENASACDFTGYLLHHL